MGGFFGITANYDCVQDVFFGVDYHSHLGKARAGMAAVNETIGFQREIHNIENSPFRTKFDNIAGRMEGKAAIGCISDQDPQPLLIRSKFGTYAITIVGMIANAEALAERLLSRSGVIFQSMSGNRINSAEILAALIEEKDTIEEGIRYAQDAIEGALCLLLLFENGHLVCARDKVGRLPVTVGKNEDGFCVSFESFAYEKLGFEPYKELSSGEILELSPTEAKVLYEGSKKKKICA